MEEVLAVIGSRTFKDRARVFTEIERMRAEFNITAIVSGVAEDDESDRGPDTYGRIWAMAYNIPYIGYAANWEDMSEPCRVKINRYGKPYNALAGMNRNSLIAATATRGLAIWDGKSPGTKDCIVKMRIMNKPVRIILI